MLSPEASEDLQIEAYSSWTGHSAAVPGQSCTTPSFDASQFPKSQSCEISELHSESWLLSLLSVRVETPGPLEAIRGRRVAQQGSQSTEAGIAVQGSVHGPQTL